MLSMAECAHSSSNHHSSGVGSVSVENSNNPQSQQGSLPSPWVQVVRGEQEPIWVVRHSPPPSASSLSSLAMSIQEPTRFVDCSATQVAYFPLPLPPENFASTENSDESHVNAAVQTKKPAWNKPSTGVVEVGPMMGVVASPTLSESTEASPKFQVEFSSRAAAHESTSTSQVPANQLHPQNHVASNATPNSTSNHAMPIRQTFNRHGIHSGNGGGPPHGEFIRPSQTLAPSFPMFQVPLNSYGNPVPLVSDTSLRETSFPNNNWNPRPIGGSLPQPHLVNDHHSMSRRGNFNPHMHRNSVHHNYENRLDHGRGSYVNGINIHMHRQRPHPRSFRGPSISSSYMPSTHIFPQPARAYGAPMFYQDFVYCNRYLSRKFHWSITEVKILCHNIQLINLFRSLLCQPCCNANLVGDSFLKSHMDDQGWVSINLVAGFPRVKKLTNGILLILDSLRASTIVEVHGEV